MTALLVLLVLLVAAVKKEQKSLKCGDSSGHTTKLEQSIFSLDIYGAPLSVKTLHTNIRIR
jgi:hypothetical protein